MVYDREGATVKSEPFRRKNNTQAGSPNEDSAQAVLGEEGGSLGQSLGARTMQLWGAVHYGLGKKTLKRQNQVQQADGWGRWGSRRMTSFSRREEKREFKATKVECGAN